MESKRLKHLIFKDPRELADTWKAPPEGFIRLDTDGSVNHHRQAACGGIIRNSLGEWIVGFQQKLGFLPSTSAEVHGILSGLRLCKQQGFTKIIAVTDSLEAYQLIMKTGGFNHPLRQELNEIRDHLYSDWDMDFHYEPRETIKCADFLATTAHGILDEMVIYTTPPPGCTPLIRGDLTVDQGLGPDSRITN